MSPDARSAERIRLGLAALGLLAVAVAAYEAAANEREADDPVGVWICLMYGEAGDQRFYLALAADGGTRIARPVEADEGEWRVLGPWRRSRERSRERIEFADPVNARLFVAEHIGEDLGGTWLGVRDGGGWWCAAAAYAPGDEPPPARGLMELLVPAIMASPSYPLRAIREAREGRTVSCFIVTGNGEIRRPVVLEATDDVFREPTLEAVAGSRYRSWGDDDATLPACRSFIFELGADD